MSTPILENIAQVKVRSGETGEVLFEVEQHNDISDDLLACGRFIYTAPTRNEAYPYCFLLKDGADWDTFTWDRKNPWAPYCATLNNIYDGGYDTTANPHWVPKSWSFVDNRHKLFFQWTKLADDMSVRAFGLTGWDNAAPNFPASQGIVSSAPGVFVPQTLVILPSAALVKGRKGGTQTPDILEISYYLSAVGVN